MRLGAAQAGPKSRCTVAPTKGGLHRWRSAGSRCSQTSETIADVDRLGNEIAELSAHLDAATGRLLDLIREFDERRGWSHGFRSCAHWLAWRASMDLGAAREALYQRTRDVDAAPAIPDMSAETPSMAQQQADALALIAETALHHGIEPGAPGERYQVVVHIDAPVLADVDASGQSVLADGTRVSSENVPPPGVRCDEGHHAARRGRPHR